MDKSSPQIAAALGVRPLDDIEDACANSIVDESFGDLVEYQEDSEEVPSVTKENKTDIENAKKVAEELIKEIDDSADNVKDIIDKGTGALNDLLHVAKSSEQARAYEVLANLMKTLIDANERKVELYKQKKYESADKELEDEAEDNKNGTTVTNNTVVLTTADLLSQVLNNKDKIIDHGE